MKPLKLIGMFSDSSFIPNEKQMKWHEVSEILCIMS